MPNEPTDLRTIAELARSVRGGPGGLMITSCAGFMMPYVKTLPPSYAETAAFINVAFFLVGFIIMTASAVRSFLAK